jgi:trimeric autotransporter adhesin
MAASLYNDGTMRNSIVVDVAHELTDYITDARRTSFAGMSAGSILSNISYAPGTSIMHDNCDTGDQLQKANLYATSQEGLSFSKASRPQFYHQAPLSAGSRHSDNSDESCLGSLQLPPSKEPSSGEDDDSDEDEQSASCFGAGADDEETSNFNSDADSADEETGTGSDQTSSDDSTTETSENSIQSGAETVPWTRREASSTCVGSDVYSSHHSAPSASSVSISTGIGSFHTQSSPNTDGTATTTSTSSTTATTEANSISALPSTLFYQNQSVLGRVSAGRRRKESPQPSQEARQQTEATHNDMSQPFIFTPDDSFGAFPSPPDEAELAAEKAAAVAEDEALQHSAVFSEMGFSYGGTGGSVSTAPLARSSNGGRPPSQRRSLNCTSLSQINAAALHRQSSAMASMLYSTIDGGMCGGGGTDAYRHGALSSWKPGMEGTFPSSTMYLYARTPSALNRHGSGAAGASVAALGSAASSSSVAAAYQLHHNSPGSTDSDSSGVTSSSLSGSDDDNSNEGHTSFFKSVRDVKGGNAAGTTEGAGSVHPRTLLPGGSGFSPGLNVRVLRGDFEAGDASLDSRELAKAAKKAAAASAAAAATTRTSTHAAGTSGKTHAVQSGASRNSPAGITRDSENSNAQSGRHNDGAAAAAATTEAMRRRSSGNTFLNFTKGNAAHLGRSATSMTMSSAWGPTPAPSMSQQTVVVGWKLLSFRETDDAPLTNTENVPHDKTKRKKGKKGKKGKKSSSKPRRARCDNEDADEAGRADECENHGNVARDVANAMVQNEQCTKQQLRPHEAKEMAAENGSGGKTSAAAALAAAQRVGSAPAMAGNSGGANLHSNVTTSTVAVALGSKAGQNSSAKDGGVGAAVVASQQDSKDGKPRTWPPAPPSLPPITSTTAPSRMRVARPPMRSASVTSATRTTSANPTGSRPASSDAADGQNSGSNHHSSNANGNRNPRDAFFPSGSRLSSGPITNGVASAGATSTVEPKKPTERIDEFKEAPGTSPSATVRRTTVRAKAAAAAGAGKPKVLVNASRRVNLGTVETTATGVRRFRPNAATRLKTVMSPSTTRSASTSHGSAVTAPKPSPPERLPPL